MSWSLCLLRSFESDPQLLSDQRVPPILPESREANPKEAIPATKLRPLDCAIEDENLLTQDKDLCGER
jgi:hypothetical protein